MSQTIFAEKCGLTQGNIAHMENGTEPKQSNVSKLIEGFPDLDAYWLLSGEGTMLRDERNLTHLPKPASNTPAEPEPTDDAQMPAVVRRKVSRPLMMAEPNLDHLSPEKKAEYWEQRYKKEIRRQAEEFEAAEHQETLRLINFNSASSNAADLYAFADSLAVDFPYVSEELLSEVRSLSRFTPTPRVIPMYAKVGFQQQAS